MSADSLDSNDLPGSWSVSGEQGELHFSNQPRNLRASFSDSSPGLFVVRQSVRIDGVETELIIDELHLSDMGELSEALKSVDRGSEFVPLLTIDTSVESMVDLVCATRESVEDEDLAVDLVHDLMDHAYGDDIDFDEWSSVESTEGVESEIDKLELHVFPISVEQSTDT